jgi:hypothetical protein
MAIREIEKASHWQRPVCKTRIGNLLLGRMWSFLVLPR